MPDFDLDFGDLGGHPPKRTHNHALASLNIKVSDIERSGREDTYIYIYIIMYM